jgi:uncharacterized protein (TIGR02145 family)
MKETGFAHWLTPNEGATNASGFTALGAGVRGSDGGFYDLKITATMWTATDTVSSGYVSEHIEYDIASTYTNGAYNDIYGFSARCVKN